MKKSLLYIFLFFGIFSSTKLYSQAPNWLWVKGASSNSSEYVNDVAVNRTTGDVYIVGVYGANSLNAFYGANMSTVYGNSDAYLVKYNSNGVFQWSRRMGGTGNDAALSVAVDNVGDVVVVGKYQNTANFYHVPASTPSYDLTSAGSDDIFIAKYNSAGTFQWAARGGGTGSDLGAFSVKADANGVYVTGSYNTNGASMGSYSVASTTSISLTTAGGSSEMFLMKYSSGGVIQWALKGGSSLADAGYDVVADANNVYVIGEYLNSFTLRNASQATVAVVSNSNTTGDIFIASYSQAGAFNWVTNIASSIADYGRGITLDANYLYVTGGVGNNASYKFPTPAFTTTSSANQDVFLAKLNISNGVFQFAKTENGAPSGTELASSISYHSSGKVFIGGRHNRGIRFTSQSTTLTPSPLGTNDIFIANYTTNGNLIYAKGAGGTNSDFANGIDNDNNGDVYVGGDAGANCVFSAPTPTTLTGASSSNIWVAKVGCGVVLTTPSAGSDQTVCATTYTLNGNNPTTGSGTWSLQSGSGVITTPTSYSSGVTGLGVGINKFVWKISGSGCASLSDTVSIDRDDFPTTSNAGVTMSLCGTTTVLAGNVPVVGTGTWSTFAGTSTITNVNLATSAVTVAAGTPSSVTNFSWSIGNGVCPNSTSTVSIISYTPSSPSNAGSTMSVCGTATTLAGNVPAAGTGTWSTFAGTSTITNVNLATSQVTVGGGSPSSITNFSWTIKNGVCPSTTSTVSIISYTNSTPSNAGATMSLCGTSTVFAANVPSAGSGTWTTFAGTSTITNANLATSAVTVGGGSPSSTTNFSWTIQNGVCPSSTSTVSIISYTTPSTSNAGPSQSVCATTATMAGNTPAVGTGSWTLVSGSGLITSPTSPNTGLTALGVGVNIFQWSITNGVCASSTSTMSITRYAAPTTANAGPNQTVCAGTATMAGNSAAVGTGTWTLVSGSGTIVTPTLETTQITGLGVGLNVFQWEIGNGVCPTTTSTMSIQRDDVPTVSSAGPNQSVCATTATMAGNTPAVGTGSWTLVSGSALITSPTSPNTGITALGLNVNVFMWTTSNGVCPNSTSTMSIQRDAAPTVASAGPNQTVCASTATMAGNTPVIGTGNWTLLSGSAVITTPTSPNTGLTTIALGSNIFEWSITNGVCPASTSTVEVYRDNAPSLSNAGPNQTVCATTATLAGNTPAVGTGSWTLISGSGVITSPTSPNSGITALGVGVNVFQWTVVYSTCPPSISTVAIQRDAVPTTANAGPTQSLCATTSTTLAGNTAITGNGLWTLISGAGTITTPSSETSGITALGTGTNIFQWTISNGVCPSSSSTVALINYAAPTSANAGANQTVCATVATMAGNVPAVGTGSWTLISGSGTITNPTLATTGLTGLGVGVNIFQWTISNGVCPSSSATVSIQRDASPGTAVAGPNQTVCATTATMAATTPTAGSGLWTLVSGSALITTPALATTGITSLGAGINVFQWTISNGVCPSSSATISIQRDLNPTTANAGPNQSVCATTATLAGNTIVIGVGVWNVLLGSAAVSAPTSPNSSVIGLSPGSNIFEWYATNGVCPASSSTVEVWRDLAPTTSNAGVTQSVCSTTATMAGNTPVIGTGVWTLISGSGFITNPNSPTTGLTAIGNGTNIFQWTISNGSCPPSTSTVAIIRYIAPTAANAGPNQTVCATTATMAGNTIFIGTGAWTLISGSGNITTPSSESTGITALGVGVNVFQWTSSNGTCPTSSSTVSIQHDQTPTASNAGSNQSVCATTATMNGNTPVIGTGTWVLISGSGNITSPNSANTGITALGIGVNVFQWTIGNGICPNSSSTVSIQRDAVPSMASAGSNQTVCATTATLAGNTPTIGVGLWTLISGAGTITSPNAPATGLSALGVGVNVFQWTISNGSCPGTSSTVSIQRDNNPTASVAGSNQTVCATAATLAGNMPAIGTGSWTLVSGSAVITSPTSPNSGVTALGVGVNVFQWAISNGVCPGSSSTVSIQRDAFPSTANAGSSQTFCAAGSYTMAGNTPTAGTGLWTLVSGAGTITTPTLPTTGITALGNGTNIFQWTISNGVCASTSSTMSILNYAMPTAANAGPNQSICATGTLLAGNTPVVGVGVWNVVTGPGILFSPAAPNSSVVALQYGINQFEWSITNGICPVSTSTVTITAYQNPSAANAGPSQSVCASTATLAGNTPAIGTGSWSLFSGSALITTPSSPNSGLTAVGIGTNILQWTITNGVCAASTSTVRVQRDANPTAASAGSSQSVCAISATLAGNTPAIGTGSWTLVQGAGSITTPTSPNSAVTALGTSTSVLNIFMWTITNGVCPPSTSTVGIDADDAPTTANAGSNQTICTGTATLAGNTPAVGTGSWTLISGTAIITTPTLETSGLTGVAVGTNVLQWTITNGVCPPSSSTVAIIRNSLPTPANAGPTQSVCASSATMAANAPAVGTGSWTVIQGSGTIANTTLATTPLSALGTGTNVFMWTITNGVCPPSTSTVMIEADAVPTTANAGPSQTLCATTTTLNGNVPAIGTGSWTLISGLVAITNPTLANTTITSAATGTNILQWTISNGICPASTATVGIYNLPNPSPSNAGPDQTICSPTTNMAGNVPAVGTGSWTVVSGAATIITPTLATTGLTGVAVGTNVLLWTISNGVCPNTSSTVAVVRDPNPTVANAGPNQTICIGNATLAGNTPAIGTGSWTLLSGSAVITTPTLETSGLTAVAVGTNILQWTISNGVCPPSTSTVAVIRDPIPTVASATPNQTICSGTTTLNGNAPTVGTGLWTLISGVTTIATPTLNTSGVTGVAVGTNVLQWTISNGVCPSSSATMSIVRDPVPTVANAGPNQTICVPAATLTGNTPAVGTGVWTLLSGSAVITTPTLETSGLTAVAVGTNILQWTISNGVCPPSISTVAIVRDPIPTAASAGPNQTICPGATVLAANSPTIGTGVWSVISGAATITTPTLNTSPVTAVAIGTNILQWTISNGVCPSSTSTMSIQRDAMPTPAMAGPNQTICATATVLAGNTPAIGTGSWSLISGAATVPTPTLETSSVTAIAIGTNVLQWTISNGVCPASSSTMSIRNDAMPSVSSAGPNQTICPNSTILAGNTPAIGTGSWTLLSGIATISTPTSETSGVTAIAVGTNVLQWTISNGVCPSSSSTMSIQRDAMPTVSNAGPNQTVCATTATLAGNTPVIGTGNWTLISGSASIVTPTLAASTLTSLAGGVNVLQWTISNGVCPSSSSTVSVQRDLDPTVASAGVNQTVCATTATLAGNTPTIGTGLWTLVSGGALITTPTATNSGLTALSVGVNVFQWTISNGVCPSSTSTVSVQRDANPTAAVAGPNQTVCATTAVLAGNTPAIGTGSWTLVSGGGSITTPTSATSGLTSLTVGVNVFEWTTSNGVCPSTSSTVSIQRDDNPTTSIAGPSQSVCLTNAVMAANTPTVGTGLWTLVSGSGNLATPTLPNSAVSNLGIGVNVFQWTISNGVCPSSTSTMAITAYTNPATSLAGPDQTICATSTVLAANTPSIGTGSWSLIAGTGVITTPGSPNSGVTGLGVGVNIFQWTISNGVCAPSTSTMSIQRDDNPTTANAGPNQTLCVNFTNLNATPLTVGTGSWALIAGTGTINNPTSAASSYTGLAIGSNILQWTTSNGVCPSTSSTVDITGIANVAPVDAGPDVAFCGLTATLSGLTPTVGTGTWVPVSAAPAVNSPNNPTSSINFGGYGTYTYIWFVGYASCPNESDTVNVTLYNMPTPASVAADQTICVAGSTISANTPIIGTGSWSVVAGSGTVTSPSATISPVSGLSIGMNSFQWMISNGVCPPSSATMNIQVDDNPSTPIAGADQTICISSNATLNATVPAIGTGTWSLVGGSGSIITPTANNSDVTTLSVGVNTFEWIVSNGVCPTKADSVRIFVDDLPSTAVAGADQFTCSMNTFMAGTIPAIGNGTWVPVGTAPSVNSPTSFSSAVSFTDQGVYSYVWTVGNGVCPNTTDIVTINTFLNPSDPDAGADQVICAMNTTLTANTISVGTGSWIAVDPLSSVTNSLVNTTGAALPNQGVFGFVWQTSNSAYCPVKNDTMYIRTYSNPSTANAGIDINGNCFLNTLIAVTPSVGSGNWTIISGTGVFDDPSNPNANYTSDVDGITKLVWTVSNGVCPPSSDTMDIIIDPLMIPQIITPNNDGNNDMFEIRSFRCLTGIKINVFNRWGNLVYESDDYKNDFIGLNMRGEKLADDTYYYVLEVGKKTYKGYVVVKTE